MSSSVQYPGQNIERAVAFQQMLVLRGTPLLSIDEILRFEPKRLEAAGCYWNQLQHLWTSFLPTQCVQLSYSPPLLAIRSLGAGNPNFGGPQSGPISMRLWSYWSESLTYRTKRVVFLQKEAVGWEMSQGKDGYRLSFLIRPTLWGVFGL